MELWVWSRGGLGSSTASGELEELKLSDSPSEEPATKKKMLSMNRIFNTGQCKTEFNVCDSVVKEYHTL